MNYFKGSGSCGLSMAPNYKKIKSGMEKSISGQNVLIQKKDVNNGSNSPVKT